MTICIVFNISMLNTNIYKLFFRLPEFDWALSIIFFLKIVKSVLTERFFFLSSFFYSVKR